MYQVYILVHIEIFVKSVDIGKKSINISSFVFYLFLKKDILKKEIIFKLTFNVTRKYFTYLYLTILAI